MYVSKAMLAGMPSGQRALVKDLMGTRSKLESLAGRGDRMGPGAIISVDRYLYRARILNVIAKLQERTSVLAAGSSGDLRPALDGVGKGLQEARDGALAVNPRVYYNNNPIKAYRDGLAAAHTGVNQAIESAAANATAPTAIAVRERSLARKALLPLAIGGTYLGVDRALRHRRMQRP